ncbi:MAG: DUF4363 family protein [Clostridiales bacterium]|nr:DUF4363 family protein [Clostridiales bacterium]
MKRFWICGGLVLALFGGALLNLWYVETVTGRIADGLNQAEEAVAQGDWDAARTLTAQAQEVWEGSQLWLSVTLSLCDTDEVSTGFQEVQGFLQWEAGPEYDGANGTLVAYVEHLAETERITIRNLL